MNKIVRSVLGASFSLASLVAGCKPEQIVKTEYSQPMQEKGQVVDNLHSDKYHHRDEVLQPRYDFMNDRFDIALTTNTVNLPETWGVVFRCEHGNKFAIQGSEQRYKDLWLKLDPQTNVIIDYREIYCTTYKDLDNDGEVDDVFSRKLIDYDFLDANPVQKEKENSN